MKAFLDGNEKAQRALTAIRKTATYAQTHGVTLTVEPFGIPNSLTSYISQIEWLLERIPELRCTFDYGNFYLNRQDISLAYDKLAQKSVHVHCKDYLTSPAVEDQDYSHAKIAVPVGEGNAPTERVVRRLLANGYNGYFTVEHLGCPRTANVLEKSAKFLRSIAKKGEV
jgi:sugar phosphate isomerase/epimerase